MRTGNCWNRSELATGRLCGAATRSLRHIIRYKVLTELLRCVIVINQLPPPRAFPLSLFDDTAALQTGPHEPAFDQYSAEIHHFLNPSSDDTPEIISWRRGEVERLRNATRDETDTFRDGRGSFGNMYVAGFEAVVRPKSHSLLS